ncbi:MAG: ABC transporter C-terminal domain-containing protein, partial [Bacteroidia bacterium]|nr:ABC transporter C-terminal domain-containing protein [Bacteroidia bacterium]
QYELETIEKELGALSKRKKEIEEKLGQLSTEFEEITMLGLDLEMLQDELDEKEIRWLELEELRTAP